jgi:hypothetical protein
MVRNVQRMASEMRRLPDSVEKVFCGDAFVDVGGATRFNASTSTTGSRCLSVGAINSMGWSLQGIVHYGRYVAPKIPGPVEWIGTPPVLAALLGTAVLTLLLSLSAFVFIVVYRRLMVVRLASPVFLAVLTFGTTIMGSWLIVTAWASRRGHLSTEFCNAIVWVSGTSFALVFGSLCAKVWRISALVNNKKLKRLRITSQAVARLILFVLVAELVLLLVLHFVFPRVAEIRTLVEEDGMTRTAFCVCSAKDGNPGQIDGHVILKAGHLILLAWGALLAFTTRNAPIAFNESRWMALSIYNVIACEILAAVMEVFASSTPGMQLYGLSMRLGAAPSFMLVLFFAPKMYSALRDFPEKEMTSHSTTDSASAPESTDGLCTCLWALLGKARFSNTSQSTTSSSSGDTRKKGGKIAPIAGDVSGSHGSHHHHSGSEDGGGNRKAGRTTGTVKPPQAASAPDIDYNFGRIGGRGKYQVVTGFETGTTALHTVREDEELDMSGLSPIPEHPVPSSGGGETASSSRRSSGSIIGSQAMSALGASAHEPTPVSAPLQVPSSLLVPAEEALVQEEPETSVLQRSHQTIVLE